MSDTHRQAAGRPKAERFAALDAIRGLAALAVVGFHAYKDIVKREPGGSGPLTTILYSLDWGVVVFFVLSGFLLYYPFAKAIAGDSPWPSVRQFLWRRAVRILPAYWLALVVYGTIARPSELWTPGGIVRYGLLQQVYNGSTVYHVLAPAWTLALEATFYLSVPLVAAMLGGRLIRGVTTGDGSSSRRRGVVLHIGGLAVLVVAAVAVTKLVLAPLYGQAGEDPSLSGFTLLGTFPLFATGMALAIVRAHRAGMGRLRAAAGRPAWSLLRSDGFWLVLAGTAYAAALVVEGNHIAPWHSTYFATALAGCVMVPLVFRPQASRFARALSASRPLVWLGTVSYGLYLWHWPVQELAMRSGWQVPHTWPGYVEAVLTVLAISLVPAWLSYRFLEAPLVSWARRVGGGRQLGAQRGADRDAAEATLEAGREAAPDTAPGAAGTPSRGRDAGRRSVRPARASSGPV